MAFYFFGSFGWQNAPPDLMNQPIPGRKTMHISEGVLSPEALEIARATMARLGLNGFEERVTYKLSGREKKLVSLATVLAMQPQLLLLDEPTTGL